MCGIAGHIGHSEAPEAEIRGVLGSLQHRGPDDEGIYRSEGAWLGHRRLAIIDLAGGHQPISNEDRSIWIVCNGEIYNYEQLRRELIAKGHSFATRSDSEVIVHLYEEMGTKCIEQLRGMFAFAIWDETKRRLFAARDWLGQRPLYYSHSGSELRFSSEIKGLLAMEGTRANLDLEALDQYLALRIIASPKSMFTGIQKLPPGHLLTFDQESGLQISRYWDLEYEPKLQGSEDDLIDELEERLIDAIKLHMVSDVPVGAFLSGGLDSTLLIGLLMTGVQSETIQTFTLGLPHGDFDETPYARIVANRYETTHHEKRVTPSIASKLPHLIHHLDEPSDPLSACCDLIAEMASEKVKVVLCGTGGDELFGGYDRYYGNVYAGYYSIIPRLVRRHVMQPVLQQLPGGDWYKSISHQLKWLQHTSFFPGGERYAQGLGYFYFLTESRHQIYDPAVIETVQSFDPYAAVREAYDRAPAENPIDKMLYSDFQVRCPDHQLMILDRTGMAHGLETRCPFMDHKVAEFAARLPASMKIRGRNLRYIQKRLCERYLPEELMARRKQGFASALPYLLRDEFRHLSASLLGESQLARDGIWWQPAINRLLVEHARGNADHGNRLWLLINSEAWYRYYIKGLTVEDLSQLISEGSDRRSTPSRELRRTNVVDQVLQPESPSTQPEKPKFHATVSQDISTNAEGD